MTSLPRPGDQPSDRELDVLTRVAGGNANRLIGIDLGLTEDTVKTHLQRVFRKLGATDRAHAVALAYERGILPMPAGSTPRVLPGDIAIGQHVPLARPTVSAPGVQPVDYRGRAG